MRRSADDIVNDLIYALLTFSADLFVAIGGVLLGLTFTYSESTRLSYSLVFTFLLSGLFIRVLVQWGTWWSGPRSAERSAQMRHDEILKRIDVLEQQVTTQPNTEECCTCQCDRPTGRLLRALMIFRDC